jgi:hypothetical protein
VLQQQGRFTIGQGATSALVTHEHVTTSPSSAGTNSIGRIRLALTDRATGADSPSRRSIVRNGRLEEVNWTYSYSPGRTDDGSIGGDARRVHGNDLTRGFGAASRQLLRLTRHSAAREISKPPNSAELSQTL